MNVREELKKIVHETVFECGQAPSGSVYAVLMRYVDLETYQSLVDELVAEKRVKLSNHLLTPGEVKP